MNHWLVAWRNLMRRKLRSFLMILSIVIGVASTFAVVAAVDSAEKAFPIYLKNAFGKADFNINGTEAYFSEGVHQDVKKMESTTSIAVLKENTRIEIEGENLSPIQKRVVLTGYSELDTSVTDFRVVKGSLDSDGAVITDRTAKVWKVDVGDLISFKTDTGVQSIKVSAIVKYTVELMGPSSWSMANYHPWSVAVPLSVVQDWYNLSGEIDNIQVKVKDVSKFKTVESRLDQFVKNYDGIYMQPVVIDFESTFKTLDSFFLALYIAGFLGIALSAFIIFHSFYVSMKERKNEFAVLKTVGYTPSDIQAMVLTEVILISVIGTTFGLLFGYAFGLGLKSLIFLIYSVYEGSMVMMKGMILSVLAGLLVPIFAALYPIRQAGNVSVIEVLKESQATNFRSNKWLAFIGILLIISGFFIKHLLLIIPLMLGIILLFPYLFKLFEFSLKIFYKPLFRFSGEMATRNLNRNLGRSSMTSAILCLGITMIVLMSSLNSALLQTYEKVIYSSYGGNLDIMFHHVEKEDLEVLKKIDGVDEAVTYSLQSVVWTLHDQQRKLPVYGVGEEWIDRWGLIKISEESFNYGLLLGYKTACFGFLGLAFVLTSRPIFFFYALMQQFRLPSKYAYSFIASIRMLPVIVDELQTRTNALKVRGVQFSKGIRGYFERLRMYTVPLFAQSIRRAQRVAVAMEAKRYQMGAKRTYFYKTTYSKMDIVFVVIMTISFVSAYLLA